MKKKIIRPTTIHCIGKVTDGVTIEDNVAKMLAGKERVEITRMPIYTKKSDGVLPQYNIRTDRFQMAQDVMDYATKTVIAKRDEYLKTLEEQKGKENPQEGNA